MKSVLAYGRRWATDSANLRTRPACRRPRLRRSPPPPRSGGPPITRHSPRSKRSRTPTAPRAPTPTRSRPPSSPACRARGRCGRTARRESRSCSTAPATPRCTPKLSHRRRQRRVRGRLGPLRQGNGKHQSSRLPGDQGRRRGDQRGRLLTHPATRTSGGRLGGSDAVLRDSGCAVGKNKYPAGCGGGSRLRRIHRGGAFRKGEC